MDYTGNFVQITNKVSGRGLLAGSWGTNRGDSNVWQYPLSNVGPNPDGFVWMMFPDEQGYFWIVNKVSGLALVAGSWGAKADDAVYQYPLDSLGGNPDNAEGFKWSLVQAGDESHYQITNKVSGRGLLAGSWGTQPDDKVWQYELSNVGPNPDGFVWQISSQGLFHNLPALREGTRIPDVVRLTGFADNPPEESSHGLIGETRLPFWMVKDGGMSYRTQIDRTPYYALSREQYWEREYIYEYDGVLTGTDTYKTTVGMSETESRTIEDELDITVTAEASFTYGVATAGLKTEIQNKLKVSESSSKTRTLQTEQTITINRPTHRAKIVNWRLTDLYTLRRGDQTLVFSAKYPLPENVTSDVWPHGEAVAVGKS
jgi:Insecticidal Crystal Toxin, P42